MPTSELAGKLAIGPGHRCLVVNSPAGFLDRLQLLPAGGSAAESGDPPFDVALLFASNRAQLERDITQARSGLKPGGLLWVAYPIAAAGTESDLSRNHGWGALNKVGLTPTTEVNLGGSWDALQFQPFAEVPGSAIPAADVLPVGRHASPLFRVVRQVAWVLFHLMFRFDVDGRERMPGRACVVICNHLGWMDAVSLLLIFPPEPRIHFLADPTSMMRNRPLWALVKAVGGIVPVDRAHRADKVLFRQVGRCLEMGGVVALFPEGDFGPREGQLLPFKKGFAHFAVEAGVPVVPVAMTGMREIWLGKRLTVRIGEPIKTANVAADEVLRLGEAAVTSLLVVYTEPSGPRPLRRWLTGLF